MSQELHHYITVSDDLDRFSRQGSQPVGKKKRTRHALVRVWPRRSNETQFNAQTANPAVPSQHTGPQVNCSSSRSPTSADFTWIFMLVLACYGGVGGRGGESMAELYSQWGAVFIWPLLGQPPLDTFLKPSWPSCSLGRNCFRYNVVYITVCETRGWVMHGRLAKSHRGKNCFRNLSGIARVIDVSI